MNISRLATLLVTSVMVLALAGCSASTAPTSEAIGPHAGPSTAAAWDTTLGFNGSGAMKLNEPVLKFLWAGTKLHGFGKFTRAGDGTVLNQGLLVDSNNFELLPTPTFRTGFTQYYAYATDGTTLYAQCAFDNPVLSFASYDGMSWSPIPILNDSVTGNHGFAPSTHGFYNWESLSDSLLVRYIDSTGSRTVWSTAEATNPNRAVFLTTEGDTLYALLSSSQSAPSQLHWYDGAGWHEDATLSGNVLSIQCYQGKLYATGTLNVNGKACAIASFEPSEGWEVSATLDSSGAEPVVAMDCDDHGTIYFATTHRVYIASNGRLQLLGTTDGPINSLAVGFGQLLVSGNFAVMTTTTGQTISSNLIARLH